MIPASHHENCLPRNNRQPLTVCSHLGGPSDPKALMVSTVTLDYKFSLSSSAQKSPPILDNEESFSRLDRMEIEDKAHRFSTPEQNIKTLIRFYRTFPSKTSQTVAVAGISVTSLLAFLAIFYVTRFLQGYENKGNAVIIEHTLQKHLEVSIHSNKSVEQERDKKSEYEMSSNFKVFKSKEGKAKYHDTLPRELITIPTFANHEERVEELDSALHLATEKEIAETLNNVRKTVDADRKKILNKEIRMWIPGDEQLRILLVSTWQSGANFLSQMLQAQPGVFQVYEPLSYIGQRQVRSGKEAFQAQQVVHRLLDCKYENLHDYMNFTKMHLEDTIGHNERVWKSCKKGRSKMTCGDARFLSAACKMFPVQLIKTVRLRLNLTHLLLNDKKLHVKVLFMVRDPREIMNSRFSNVEWCLSSHDCSSAETLCQDLQGDLKVASAFEKLYPDRFLKIKYEDFFGNTETEATKIISFLNLQFSENMKRFLKEKQAEIYDFQDYAKKKIPYQVASWKRNLPLQKIYAIQNACSSVLKELKYDILGS